MDAFKQGEILRMQFGGNKAWQDFYNQHASVPFDEATIKERYDCEVGEEWKERLTAQVEERPFDKTAFQKARADMLAKQQERSRGGAGTPLQGVKAQGQGASRSQSPAVRQSGSGISAEQKSRNEDYFARMGNANASRPDGLPPSQGGKYAGFGSSMPEPQERQQAGGIPSADEFTKDPVGALTKGFGWFSGVVSKQAKVVNESYIQPTAKNASAIPHTTQI